MTNAEILNTECALHNITEAVDTFAGWKRKGYSVKKGKKPYARMYMVKAAFFTASQVEPIEDADKRNS